MGNTAGTVAHQVGYRTSKRGRFDFFDGGIAAAVFYLNYVQFVKVFYGGVEIFSFGGTTWEIGYVCCCYIRRCCFYGGW